MQHFQKITPKQTLIWPEWGKFCSSYLPFGRIAFRFRLYYQTELQFRLTYKAVLNGYVS